MPLRAILNGGATHAFDYTIEAWDAFKRKYKLESLLMPCCGCPAVPKTSKHGAFFFSHKAGAECSSAPESSEHIYLKSVVAKASSVQGWRTTTEYRGRTPEGEDWIADVLCQKAGATVAIEIQLSSIPYDEIIARTERYARSRVRVAWLVDSGKFKDWEQKSNKKTPIFGVNKIKLGEIPLMAKFSLAADNFVHALLSKKVKWEEEPWEYSIFYLSDICWKCKNPVKQVYGSAIDVYEDSVKTVPNASTVLSKLKKFISNDELRELGLNTVGKHENLKGNAQGFPYCNECAHCGAPQNNHYLLKHLQDGGRTTGEAMFTSPRESTGEWNLSDRNNPNSV